MAASLRLALLIVASLVFGLPAATRSALAHASLTGASPVDGSVVGTVPAELTLSFSEPVSPLKLALIFPDGSSQPLARYALRDRTLVIKAPAGLGHGTHVLSWRVVSEDGHPVGGSVLFSVGAASGSAPAIEEQVDPATRALVWSGRLGLYLALFLGCGAAAYAGWVGPLSRGARRGAAGFLLLGLLSLPVALGSQGLDALGAAPGAILDVPVWKAALATSYASTIAIATLAILAALISLRAPAVVGQATGLLSLGLAGFALASSGHASAADPQWLMRPAVFLHACAIGAWSGALMPLALGLREPDGARTLRRFSSGIPAVVAALLTSGTTLAIVQIERPAALVETAYGRVLLTKLALVALALALAGFNRWRLTAGAGAGQMSTTRALARVVIAEIAVLVFVFGTAALWRFTPPPRAIAIAVAQPASAHIHTLKAMADVTVAPGRAGPVSVSVALMNGEFGPLQAKELKLTFANPAAGIESIEREARRGPDGVWRSGAIILPVPGQWAVELEILVSDFEMLRLNETIAIRP